jgi:hypothetical protein
VPDLYSTIHGLVMAGDGTLSCTFTSAGHIYLLQRKPDGTIVQAEVPILPDPTNPQASIAVTDLAAGSSGRLDIFRSNGANAHHYQTFNGTTFTAAESIPLPPSLGKSFHLISSPRVSASSDRLCVVVNSGRLYFAALRDSTGWHFSSLSVASSSLLLTGFNGESFWCLHTQPDPLTHRPIAFIESQP